MLTTTYGPERSVSRLNDVISTPHTVRALADAVKIVGLDDGASVALLQATSDTGSTVMRKRGSLTAPSFTLPCGWLSIPEMW